MHLNCGAGTLESPLDCKEIKPVNPKGNQSWVFTGRRDAEAEAPILWPPDVKSQLTGKDPNAGKDWGQEKRAAEDEIVRWHYQLNGHEFEQSLGDSEGQGSLVCYSPWGREVEHDLVAKHQLITHKDLEMRQDWNRMRTSNTNEESDSRLSKKPSKVWAPNTQNTVKEIKTEESPEFEKKQDYWPSRYSARILPFILTPSPHWSPLSDFLW